MRRPISSGSTIRHIPPPSYSLFIIGWKLKTIGFNWGTFLWLFERRHCWPLWTKWRTGHENATSTHTKKKKKKFKKRKRKKKRFTNIFSFQGPLPVDEGTRVVCVCFFSFFSPFFGPFFFLHFFCCDDAEWVAHRCRVKIMTYFTLDEKVIHEVATSPWILPPPKKKPWTPPAMDPLDPLGPRVPTSCRRQQNAAEIKFRRNFLWFSI